MRYSVVGMGEVLWDLLPGGRQMGGAPANVVCHAAALGADASLVTRVGRDADGDAIRQRLEGLGVDIRAVELDPEAPTGTVTVDLDAGGQPQFTIHEGVAWDRLEGGAAAREVVARADAVCFGTLAQRGPVTRGAMAALLGLVAPGAWRVLDVNLRQHYHSPYLIESSLARANVLKVNDAELPLLAEWLQLGDGTGAQMAALAERWGLRVVACTRGGRGSLVLADGRWSDHPGVPVQVADTVGAGDAFTAAMILGLLGGWDVDEWQRQANEVAAFVASRSGAIPALPPERRAPFLALSRPVGR
jgi:fructokinase